MVQLSAIEIEELRDLRESLEEVVARGDVCRKWTSVYGVQFSIPIVVDAIGELTTLDVADRFLMIPDFLHWMLSGEECNETTNASTTQLLNPTTGLWSEKILKAFEIPERLFSKPMQPGTVG